MTRRFSHFAARWSWLPWLIVGGCQGACRQPVTPPPDASDAGDPCPELCAKVQDAGCMTAGPLCLTSCHTDQAQGNAAQLDPIIACVHAAAVPDAVRACPGACGP